MSKRIESVWLFSILECVVIVPFVITKSCLQNLDECTSYMTKMYGMGDLPIYSIVSKDLGFL